MNVFDEIRMMSGLDEQDSREENKTVNAEPAGWRLMPVVSGIHSYG